MLLLAILGLVIALVLPLLGVLGMTLFTSVLLGGFIIFSGYTWIMWRLDFPQVAVIGLIAVQTVVIGSLGFVRAHKERAQIKSIFDQYVPPAHIETMLDELEQASMAG